MKKILLIATLIVTSMIMYAQNDVTKFLGIPVDGTKEEMIRKLKQKGFVLKPNSDDILTGEFNGGDVEVSIGTNKGRVCRIVVHDAYGTDVRNIKQRFNRLYGQFKDNKKYMSASLSDRSIPDGEDISYEMSANNKRYEAAFYQLPEDFDYDAFMEEFQSFILSKYTAEQLGDMQEEERNTLMVTAVITYMIDKYSNNSVWFMIYRDFGKYYIAIFYDNENNSAHGEDL